MANDDGRWRDLATSEASTLITPKPGSKVNIKRATLGSYFIKVDGGRAVKGKRVG